MLAAFEKLPVLDIDQDSYIAEVEEAQYVTQ